MCVPHSLLMWDLHSGVQSALCSYIGLPGVRYLTGLSGFCSLSGIKAIVIIHDKPCANSSIFCVTAIVQYFEKTHLTTLFIQYRSVVFLSIKHQGSPSNYCPVCNLSFLSKLLEKRVSVRLVHYLDLHSLMPPLQSGFRKFHSTESLMVSPLAKVFHPVNVNVNGLITLLSLSLTLVPCLTLLTTPFS